MENVSATTNDAKEFVRICYNACYDDEIFNNIKKIPDFTYVLEHTTVSFGQDYLNIIKRDNPQLLDKIPIFKTNDDVGGGFTYKYGEYEISPSTLRYVKVLSDLIKLYGTLDGMKIVEIGGGYGGQCKIINDIFNFKDYHIIDLPEVVKLSEKYLSNFNVNNVRFSTYEKLDIEYYDLIISNFAFSELHKDLQMLYKEKIIDNSSNGYITCNFITNVIKGGGFPTFTKNELLSMKNNTVIIAEEPLTGPNNMILTWKK